MVDVWALRGLVRDPTPLRYRCRGIKRRRLPVSESAMC